MREQGRARRACHCISDISSRVATLRKVVEKVEKKRGENGVSLYRDMKLQ